MNLTFKYCIALLDIKFNNLLLLGFLFCLMGTCTSCCHDHRESIKNGNLHSNASSASSAIPREQPVNVTVADVWRAPSSKYSVQNTNTINVSSIISEPENGKTAVLSLVDSQGDKINTSISSSQSVVVKSASMSSKVNANSHQNKRIPSISSKEHSVDAKINSLFSNYCDETEDCILAEGIEKFCLDLDIKFDDFRILVLAWKFNASVMCRFTRQEFVLGCKKIKADSIQGILAKIPELVQEVKDKTTFRTFYRWAFRFALDADSGQRTLPLDIALQLWPLVFSQNEPRILGSWLEYLQKHQSVRGIPRDTWDMFLNFTDCVKDGYSNYDDTEAWPSLFDNFVEYETDRQNQNVDENRVKQ